MQLEEVRSVEAYDIRHVAQNLRPHDRREVSILFPDFGRAQYVRLLTGSVLASNHLFVLKCVSGKVRGIGGIADGQVWMVGTAKLDTLSSQKDVLRQGREYLRTHLAQYGCLYNLCSTDPGQLRAMAALGFTIKPINNFVARIEVCAS